MSINDAQGGFRDAYYDIIVHLSILLSQTQMYRVSETLLGKEN